jgi:hypothetical protein
MYNLQFLNIGRDEIEAQILEMPATYTSLDFCTRFQRNYPDLYEQFLCMYTRRNPSVDRRHAIQIVHTQLMHTVNDRFHHLTRKERTIANPKGGQMSQWTRV